MAFNQELLTEKGLFHLNLAPQFIERPNLGVSCSFLTDKRGNTRLPCWVRNPQVPRFQVMLKHHNHTTKTLILDILTLGLTRPWIAPLRLTLIPNSQCAPLLMFKKVRTLLVRNAHWHCYLCLDHSQGHRQPTFSSGGCLHYDTQCTAVRFSSQATDSTS